MKILLVQTGFIGDLVLSTPVVEGLLKAFPGAKLSLLTTPKGASLVCADKRLHSVITFDKRNYDAGMRGLFRIAARLRNEAFDAVFSLHKSYRTAILLWLARIPIRFGFREASLRWLYTANVSRGSASHEVLKNLAIFRAAGISPERFDTRMRLHLSSESEEVAEALTSGLSGNLIAIAPGSVWATKRWTAAGFAEVCRNLVSDGCSIVMIGGPEDMLTGQEIEQKAGVHVTNLIGRIDLDASARIIERCKVLVTNDSAPLHLASAVGTPVVALFCATIPEFGYGPWHVPHRIVEVKELSCRPCGRHGGQSCPTETFACQLKITSSQVTDAVKQLLRPIQDVAA
jgi:heptosyltransferase II